MTEGDQGDQREGSPVEKAPWGTGLAFTIIREGDMPAQPDNPATVSSACAKYVWGSSYIRYGYFAR